MTQRERVTHQIRHESTDYIPTAKLEFEGDVVERLDAYYGDSRWRSLVEAHDHIVRIAGDNRYGVDVDSTADRFSDVFGCTWRGDLRPIHLEDVPLAEPTMQEYSFPVRSDVLDEGWRTRVGDEISRTPDRFHVITMGCGLFQRSWFLRGYLNALVGSIQEPAFYEELIARECDLKLSLLDELAEAPVDGIMFSDDWGDQKGVVLGPDRWRRFIKPYAARLFEHAHRAGKYTLHHSCGDVKDIIPDLIEIGLDVLQSVQPEVMDPYYLKAEYGKDMAFWGGLGSQQLVPFGSPDQIREEVRKLCRIMGEGGGYILGPAKAMQPETPTDNAAAVVDSFLAEVGISPSDYT